MPDVARGAVRAVVQLAGPGDQAAADAGAAFVRRTAFDPPSAAFDAAFSSGV